MACRRQGYPCTGAAGKEAHGASDGEAQGARGGETEAQTRGARLRGRRRWRDDGGASAKGEGELRWHVGGRATRAQVQRARRRMAPAMGRRKAPEVERRGLKLAVPG